MRYLRWAVVGLFALVAAAVVVGVCLPLRDAGSVSMVLAERSPEQVWDAAPPREAR